MSVVMNMGQPILEPGLRGDIESQSQDSENSSYGKHPPVSKVLTSGDDNEFLHIGHTKVRRDELLAAFGGDLRPGLYAPSSHKFANPSPLGLMAFSTTTFVLSLCNLHARHVSTPNIVVGLAFFYGGFIQLCAGMWEMVVENTFGATALSSYGGFWLSWAAIQTDAFGIVKAYKEDELSSALGFYLIAWFIFTFLLVLVTLRSTVAFFALFFFLDLTFLLLACAEFTGHVGIGKAAGWIGVVTAAFGYYNAYAGLATHENTYFTVKAIPMPGALSIKTLVDEEHKRDKKQN